MKRNEEINERIRQAVNNTKELSQNGLIPEGYFESTLASRQPDTGFGSTFQFKVGESHLVESDWQPYPNCPNLMDGCTAFWSPIPGYLGVVSLQELNQDAVINLTDPKGTGKKTPEVSLERSVKVDFTTLIVGEEAGKEIVFTFHPGKPIRPSQYDGPEDKMTVREAIEHGMTHAKIR